MNKIDNFLDELDNMDIVEEMDNASKVKLAAAGSAAAALATGVAAGGIIASRELKEKKALNADKAPLKEMEKKYQLKIKQANAKISAGKKSKNWSLAISGCNEAIKLHQAMINEVTSIKNTYRRKASNSKVFANTCDTWIESFKEDIETYQAKLENFKLKKSSSAKESFTFFDIINDECVLESFLADDCEFEM